MAGQDIKISQLPSQVIGNITDDTLLVSVTSGLVTSKILMADLVQYIKDSLQPIVYRFVSNQALNNLPETYTTIALLDTGESYPAGEYVIGYSFTAKWNVINASIFHQFSYNGNPFEERSKEVKDATDVIDNEYLFPITLSVAGPITFELQSRKENSNGTFDVLFANIMLDRKDDVQVP